jgi:hypothetical protein
MVVFRLTSRFLRCRFRVWCALRIDTEPVAALVMVDVGEQASLQHRLSIDLCAIN